MKPTFPRILALSIGALAIALACASTALADGLPAHGAPSPACVSDGYGRTYIQSPMPYMDVRPESFGTIGDGGTGTAQYDEWVTYRLVLGWRDSSGQMQYAGANRLASLNGYPNAEGYGAWTQDRDGSWRFLQPGSWTDMSLIVSGLQVNPGVTFFVWGEYVWGPFGSYAALDHFEYAGTITCR